MFKRTWIMGFVVGLFCGVSLLAGILVLAMPARAEAQLPELPHEQIQIFREMSASLKGIQQALQRQCP